MSSLGDLLLGKIPEPEDDVDREDNGQTFDDNDNKRKQIDIKSNLRGPPSNDASNDASNGHCNNNQQIIPDRVEKKRPDTMDDDHRSNASSTDDLVRELLDPNDRPRNVWHVVAEGTEPRSPNDEQNDDRRSKDNDSVRGHEHSKDEADAHDVYDRDADRRSDRGLSANDHDDEHDDGRKLDVGAREDEDEDQNRDIERTHSDRDRHERKRSRNADRDRDRDRERERERERERDHDRERERGRDHDRERERGREREHEHRRRSPDRHSKSSRSKRSKYSDDEEDDRDRKRHRGGRSRRHERKSRSRSHSRDSGSRRRRHRSRSHDSRSPITKRNSKTILVMQLSPRVVSRDLEDFFEEVGRVKEVRLIMDSKTRRHKGIAYIEFDSASTAAKALALNGKKFHGVPMQIQSALSEKARASIEHHSAPTSSSHNSQHHSTSHTSSSHYSSSRSYLPPNSYRVYMGGLNVGITEEMLRTIVEPFGMVHKIELIKDRTTGLSRGYAFITFATAEDGKEAIRNLDGFELAGKNLRVSKSTEKSEH